MKPGDLVRDFQGEIGIVVKIVPDVDNPYRTWVHYYRDSEVFLDDIKHFEVINEAG